MTADCLGVSVSGASCTPREAVSFRVELLLGDVEGHGSSGMLALVLPFEAGRRRAWEERLISGRPVRMTLEDV